MLTGTKVMPCDCTSVFFARAKCANAKREDKPKFDIPWFSREAGALYQDVRYGKGQRLHNLGGKGVTKTATCTVCGRSKPQ